MAATDAYPVPKKNVAFRVTFPILDADGDLVTGAASLDSEISKDGGTFTDCTNEATEIATASGVYYLDLTNTEMNADTVAIIVKTGTAGAKTTVITLYPEEAGDIRANVTQVSDDTAAADNLELMFDGTGYAGGTTKLGVDAVAISGDTVAADNAEAMFDGTGYVGGTIKLGVDAVAISGDTAAADNAELMFDGTGYAGGTTKLGVDVVAISGDSAAADNLEAAADGTTYNLGGGAVVAASVTGAVGSVASGGITAASIAADAIGASELAADAVAEIADAVWDEARSGHVGAGSFGEGVATVQGNVTGNVNGSVGSVATGGITAASIAADAIGASELATDAVNEIRDAVLSAALTEAYATDGSTFTIPQALYMIWSYLAERSVSGTTVTLKKLDGTTTSMTMTINDASTPTSITRAT